MHVTTFLPVAWTTAIHSTQAKDVAAAGAGPAGKNTAALTTIPKRARSFPRPRIFTWRVVSKNQDSSNKITAQGGTARTA